MSCYLERLRARHLCELQRAREQRAYMMRVCDSFCGSVRYHLNLTYSLFSAVVTFIVAIAYLQVVSSMIGVIITADLV